MVLLTKTKYKAGLACPKYLWMLEHDGDKLPEMNETVEFIINQGHIIGQLAKQLYPKGIDIPESNFSKNLELTKQYLKEKKPLFEPSFLTDNLYARADILVPKGKKWNIVEVKSSTSVKEEQIHDVSFQRYVYEKSGIKINKCYLAHINKDFVKKGEIKAKRIIKKEDITEEVNKISEGIQERTQDMLKILSRKDSLPHVHIGNGCNNGYGECPSEECWSFLPEGHVFELYYGGKKSYELLEGQVQCLVDIPQGFKLNEKQEIQKECAKTGKIYTEPKKIKEFLDSFQEPVYYLDFETFSTAVPLFDGVKPYQQIPFQFSCHIIEKGKKSHVKFLHREASDPRKELLNALKICLGEKGTIIVYNQSFEIGRLKELAKAFPKEKKWVESVIARIIDLIVPFRSFWYYNPKQKGSMSIKYVLPALTEKGYGVLDIGKGDLASVKYLEATFHNGKDREKVYKDLLVYCGQDTEGMVWIVEELTRLI